MLFICAKDVALIWGVSESTAYKMIRQLQKDLVKQGYLSPPAGKIQVKYFCDRFNLELNEVIKAVSDYHDKEN